MLRLVRSALTAEVPAELNREFRTLCHAHHISPYGAMRELMEEAVAAWNELEHFYQRKEHKRLQRRIAQLHQTVGDK